MRRCLIGFKGEEIRRSKKPLFEINKLITTFISTGGTSIITSLMVILQALKMGGRGREEKEETQVDKKR